jgi:hypothetical protein
MSMRESRRAPIHLMALAALVLGGVACDGDLVERDTRPLEVGRLTEHFATVRAELLAADVTQLGPEQQRKRARHIARLDEYAAAGVFPHNHERPGQGPFFIDRHGTRCAMAYLIEQSGRGDLVARIAREANDAYVAELASDPDLVAWLGENGLTAAEAARIQPTYCYRDGADVPCNPAAVDAEEGPPLGTIASAGAGVASATLLAVNLASSEGSRNRGAFGFLAGAVSVTAGALTLGEEGRGMRALGAANIGVGLVAMAVGLDVMHRPRPEQGNTAARSTGRRTPRSRQVALQPFASGDAAGLAMGGTF